MYKAWHSCCTDRLEGFAGEMQEGSKQTICVMSFNSNHLSIPLFHTTVCPETLSWMNYICGRPLLTGFPLCLAKGRYRGAWRVKRHCECIFHSLRLIPKTDCPSYFPLTKTKNNTHNLKEEELTVCRGFGV